MIFFSRNRFFFLRALLVLFLLLAQTAWWQPVTEAVAAPQERLLLAQPPAVSLNVPAQAFIGSTVNFTVTFDNPDLNDPGYGPLIDLIIPRNGADGNQNTNPPLDGLTFVSATYLGSSIENTVLTFPGSGGVTCVNHPYMVNNTGNPVQVCGNAGDTLVALRLPFGSFTPDQPPLTANITVSMSNLADLGTPLTIQARGGYQFGYTPLNDWCCGDDPSVTFSSWVNGSVTPTLFTLSKSYNGPEDETATGPNFPRQYTVTAQIAPGQTMTAFNLTDVLPANMQFVSLIGTTPGGATCSTPSTATPGGTLSCNFASVSGTVSMTFSYYIPLREAGGGSVINPSTGDDALSCNNASSGGTWTPLDPRDTGATFTQNPAGCEHTLTPKSIATQKGVSVVGGGQPAPGRTLEYVIDIQISDFFVFDQVVLTDTISDGQRFDTTFTPTLQIIGNPASYNSSGAFNAANYTVSPNYTPADPAPNDGTTTITFRISDEMILRSGNGRLIGGCVPPGGVVGDPACSGYNDGPTTARVVFRAVIQENFSDTFPSGDPSVDQGDVLNNTEFVNGRILSTTDASTPTGFTEPDGSSASVTIGRGALTKAVYAVNGNTSFSTPVRVGAGDTVTFRLTYTLVTSDFENLVLTDYLPLPIFSATEVTSHIDSVCGVPAAGTSCLGPADTYDGLPAANTPTVSNNGTSNWVRWSYGNYDGPNNTFSVIDILFTVTVRNDPFADNLHLTNQAYVTEGSTNGQPGEAASIVEITYTSPVMTTTKSVVATDNPAPTFTPPLPIAFTAPGSPGPRWSGTINSALLTATPIDSDLSGVDAGDLVTFAIFLVNEGTGINGAFDIVIQDTFDALGFEYPIAGDPNSINLQIYYGNGSGPISYTTPADTPATPGNLFGAGIKLVDPVGQGVGSAHDPNLGNNVIVITYDLRMRSDVSPGTYPNTATLVNYSGSEGGPNFLPQPQSDDATVTTDDPLLAKTLVGTEINTPQNSNTQAVIGEFVTYTVTLTAPEGTLPNAQIVDTLDAGLAFVDLQSVVVSNPDTDGAGAGDDGIYSSVMTFNAGGNCTNCTPGTGAGSNPLISAFGGQDGRRIAFDLGTLVNTNRDNNVVETITLTYRAVVINVVGNQGGGLRNNEAALTWLNDSLPAVSAPNITIIEPVINTAKAVAPATADAGDTVTFTITLTNPAAGSTTAHDVSFSDTLPATLTYLPGTLALGACSAATPLTLNDSGAPTLTGSGGLFQPGQSCTITFQATVNYSAAPGQTITNTAISRWTSLPGDVNDRSSFNTDSDERTGADGVGGALNDYASQGAVNLTINSVQPQKFLASTSEAHTGLVSGTQRVAIGEIIRYRMVVQLPEGTSLNFQIRDNLPGGLNYLDDGTARLALLSNGSPIASTEPTGSTLGLALGSGSFGSGPWVNGNDPTLVTPTYALPDPNVGSSNSLTADPDVYGNGTDPFFKLGTLTNNDNDADAEYVIIEFNALVNNSAAGSNDAGDPHNNTFSVFIGGTQNGPNSNPVQTIVAEPFLSLAKTLATIPTDAGDPITYTLTITSASGANRSTAFDLTLTDTFDANLTGLTVSGVTASQGPTCVGNGAGTTAFSHNGGSFSGSTLTFTATCLDPGQTITITITGTVAATAPVGYVIPNTANLVYTSLPGPNGTTSNPTGSSTPGTSGSDTGERDGSDGPGGAVDDYAATSTVNTPLSVPQIDKLAPNPTFYVIGEQVTFDILVTLPEGLTPNLQVVDDLPLGLEYVSHQVITTAAASGGVLVADYNGTLPAPTVTAPGGSGGDLTLAFGNTTTAADNVANNNAFLVRVVARVLNVAGNQNGTTLTNSATVSWTGGSANDTTPITLREPELDIQKAANDTSWLYGQTVTYTITVSHLASSTADARDLTITDTIPNVLTYVPGSITASAGCVADDTGAPTLTWTCATLPLASTATLTYQVTVNSPPGPPPFLTGDTTVTNTANLTWTSLPGANPDERDGSGGVNDYRDSDGETGGLEQYYALGNRVWFDTNNNAQIDSGEVGVNGVIVQLYAADGSGNPTGPVLATDTTSGGGYYHFDFLLPGDYVVVLPVSNFASGGVLEGYWSSQTTRANTGTITETLAPDPDNNVDSDDNGTLQTAGAFSGAVLSRAVTLGGAAEPTGETDLESGVGQGAQPDNRANLTVDFGFYRTEIGNLVFEDINVNGNFDSGTDNVLSGVTVELLSGDGSTVLATTTTSIGGLYLFSGQPAGNYIVRVTAPSGMISTIDAYAPADTADPDTNTDNNDNGLGTAGGVVSSNQLTMQAGEVAANITVTNANGTTTDPTVDFGFVFAYALGNRVWFDTNNNSQIDFGTELGVDGVVVNLYRNDGTGSYVFIATDTTANGGYYLFDNLLPGEYIVALPVSNFAAGGVLDGYWSSGTTLNGTGAITEAAAPDPDNDQDSDDNGTLQTSGVFTGQVISLPVTLGPTGLTEPAGETDLETGLGQGTQPDGRANMTVDFGFYRVSVGNLVYTDGDENGNYDGGPLDAPLPGITVYLYASDGVTEIFVGPDGILGTADDAPGGVVTDAGGNYRFDGLPQGNYIVLVDAPSSTTSTIDTYNAADSANPNTNADNNDNGLGTGAGTVSSAVFTLTPGSTGALNNNTVTHASGSTHDPTVDFGFIPQYALGNRVWYDTNNNRQIDAGEVGIDGVMVQLYAADGSGNPTGAALATTITANGGYYLFNNLASGNYIVVLPASNFATVLNGYWSSGTTRNNDGSLTEIAAPDPDNDTDSDDNGQLNLFGSLPGAVASSPVTLGLGPVEPTGETDLDGGIQGQPDARANMTVDFGFYTIRLGNQVWNDANNNGLLDGGETGIDGVTVQLWSADGSTLLATTTTAGGGLYTFTGLPQGSYIVRLPEGNFQGAGALRDFYSSTGGGAYEPAPNPDAVTVDDDDNGTEVGSLGFPGGYIQSGVFALTPAAEQTTNPANGSTTEFRVDFGVYNQQRVDLTVTKDDGIGYYLPGGTLTYTIVVRNDGPADVGGATVTDNLPAQIASWEWTCVTTGGATCSGSGGFIATNFTNMVSMPVGSTITYTVNANIAAAATGTLNNTVTVTPPTGVIETDPSDNSDTDSDRDAILSVEKDDGLTTVAPGSVITYTIDVQNVGLQDLTAVRVTDTLPAEVTFQSAVPAPSSISGSTLEWTGISLASGASTTITVTVRVNDTAVGPTLINSVTVMDDAIPGLTDSDDDIDIVASTNGKIIIGGDIDVDPDDPSHPAPPPLPRVLIGEVVTYQISLDVPAGATLTNLQALDILDSGLAFVSCVSVDGGNLTTTLLGGFADSCNDPLNPTVQAEPLGNPLPVNQGRRITFDFGDVTNPSAIQSETLLITYEVVVLDIAANVNGVGGLNNTVLWSWDGGSLAASALPLEIIEPDLSIDKSAQPTTLPFGSPVTFSLSIAHTPESRVDAYDVVVTDVLALNFELIPGSIQTDGLAPTSTNYNPATRTLTFVWDVFPLGQTATITFQAIFVGPSPATNTANVAWTSLPIDPQPNGQPVSLSDYNDFANERWYDPADAAGINNYGASSTITINAPAALPATGFAPGRMTQLPAQPAEKAYTNLGNMWLEIPSLGLNLPITGVPLTEDGWDLTWLSNQAGYLTGTTFPGQVGTTGLTAHVTLADGTPGPFRNLDKLYWGNVIILHADGYRYTYEVREMRTVLPSDFSVFKEDGYTWLTLLTCKGYVPWLDTYNYRYAVRAVLMKVEYEGVARTPSRGSDR
ncbi:MAG: hypothetical protein DDG60_00110 [Anaerolineae bacterium]|nr:MAG: hypothetical protein DDG60_00110 [Anaerolineae bacterium]